MSLLLRQDTNIFGYEFSLLSGPDLFLFFLLRKASFLSGGRKNPINMPAKFWYFSENLPCNPWVTVLGLGEGFHSGRSEKTFTLILDFLPLALGQVFTDPSLLCWQSYSITVIECSLDILFY